MNKLAIVGAIVTLFVSVMSLAQGKKETPDLYGTQKIASTSEFDLSCSNYVKPSLCITNGCCWTGSCVPCH